MREIKFRGKRVDNGDWVYGSYHYCVGPGIMTRTEWGNGNREILHDPVDFNSHWILVMHTPSNPGWDARQTFTPYAVIPETVGQHTTLCDSENKYVYEGDLINAGYGVGKIIFRSGCFFIEWIDDPEANIEPLGWFKNNKPRTGYIIIGNIHENPEFLYLIPSKHVD